MCNYQKSFLKPFIRIHLNTRFECFEIFAFNFFFKIFIYHIKIIFCLIMENYFFAVHINNYIEISNSVLYVNVNKWSLQHCLHYLFNCLYNTINIFFWFNNPMIFFFLLIVIWKLKFYMFVVIYNNIKIICRIYICLAKKIIIFNCLVKSIYYYKLFTTQQ